MLNPSKRAGQAGGLPLTLLNYLDACRGMSAAGHADQRPWVQVRRHHTDGPVVLCGQVVATMERGEVLFGVATAIGEVWATGRNVRLCSGDGRCTCEPAPADKPAGQTAGATAENQGKPGETAP